MTWSGYRAVLFDLDGVLTPTAGVHMRAWAAMFDEFLGSWGGAGDRSPFTDADYHAYVDGRPRFDGVRAFLASRGVQVDEDTVTELGMRKNDSFNAVLAQEGVEPFPDSVALLDHLEGLGVRLAVVSSSANAVPVLAAAGLLDRFEHVVDGIVAKDKGLPGKPAPDTFLYAAALLQASPDAAVVVEDAVPGVRAGHAGGFGLVVGVDRGVGQHALIEAGATTAVTDLTELIPPGGGT